MPEQVRHALGLGLGRDVPELETVAGLSSGRVMPSPSMASICSRRSSSPQAAARTRFGHHAREVGAMAEQMRPPARLGGEPIELVVMIEGNETATSPARRGGQKILTFACMTP
ncbi:MAG: hypothetical protein FD132_2748 [bacterium]|nr:MAG: hypothetical protein FD132_2748 [bacterium]